MNTNFDATTLLGAASSAASAADVQSRVKPNETISQNEFLRLFITQLQNQDPLSPMEPDQLTAQLAQFSSLEKLASIDTQLGKLASARDSAGGDVEALQLLGRTVEFDGSRLTVAAGKSTPVSFTLARDAAEVVATVRTSEGAIVRTVQLGETEAGEHTFAFDGKDGEGQLVADGTYRVEIAWAARRGARPAPLGLDASGVVDGVDLAADQPVLLVGDRRLTLDQVRRVRTAADES